MGRSYEAPKKQLGKWVTETDTVSEMEMIISAVGRYYYCYCSHPPPTCSAKLSCQRLPDLSELVKQVSSLSNSSLVRALQKLRPPWLTGRAAPTRDLSSIELQISWVSLDQANCRILLTLPETGC